MIGSVIEFEEFFETVKDCLLLRSGAEYFNFVRLGTPLTGNTTPRVGFACWPIWPRHDATSDRSNKRLEGAK